VAQQAEAQLPDVTEDFVEGGVELTPKSHTDEGLLVGEPFRPRSTRVLTSLDVVSGEFWPAGAGQRALFLDYDGTLREFEARPEMATPTPQLEELLEAINARTDLVPHIISGRDARFLESCFGKLSRFTLIAEHGFQIHRPGAEGWELLDNLDALDLDHSDWKERVRSAMNLFVEAMPESHIEEKKSSMVWHYREVSDQEQAEAMATEAFTALERLRDAEKLNKIGISRGHKVVEVSYKKVRKGPVMRRICEEKGLFGEPFLSVLVAGDDVSDESMFELAPQDFLSIKVGKAETSAAFRVEDPQQLRSFLWQIVAN